MSVEAFSWALTVPVGGNMKIMLLGLANHAHPDGTESYPTLETLATYGHCDRATARRNVRKLVDEGWAREDGLGPRGQSKYALALDRDPRGGSKMPPVASEPEGGDKSGAGGVTAVQPEPSIEPSKETGQNASAHASVPEGFPDELRPHAREVMRILKAVAAQHNAKAVTALAVGHLLMDPSRRHKPFVREAHNFASWAASPPRPIRDAVASYRHWIDRAGDLAGVERLGPPATGATPDNVSSIESRRREPKRGKYSREA